jgi:hypothetical protein
VEYQGQLHDGRLQFPEAHIAGVVGVAEAHMVEVNNAAVGSVVDAHLAQSSAHVSLKLSAR